MLKRALLALAPLVLCMANAPPNLQLATGQQVVVASGQFNENVRIGRRFLQAVLVSQSRQDPEDVPTGSGDLLQARKDGRLGSIDEVVLQTGRSALEAAGIRADAIWMRIVKDGRSGIDIGQVLIAVPPDPAALGDVLQKIAMAQRTLDPEGRDCGGNFVCNVGHANWWRLSRLRIANVVVISKRCANAEAIHEARGSALRRAEALAEAAGLKTLPGATYIDESSQPTQPIGLVCNGAMPEVPQTADTRLEAIALGLASPEPLLATLRASSTAIVDVEGTLLPASYRLTNVLGSDAMQTEYKVLGGGLPVKPPSGVPYVGVPGFSRSVIRASTAVVALRIAAEPDAISRASVVSRLERFGISERDIALRDDGVLLRVTSFQQIDSIEALVNSISPHTVGTVGLSPGI